MKIAIVDENNIWCKKLKEILERQLEVLHITYSINCFLDGEEFLKECKEYDIAFLEVTIHEKSGFIIAAKYKEKRENGIVIFHTELLSLCQQGYKVDAFRFLSKRGSEQDILEALMSALKKMEAKKKILVQTKGCENVLLIDDIVFVESNGRGTKIVTKTECIFTKEKISDLTKRLPKAVFYLTHRAFLVNLNYICKVNRKDIVLDNGMKVLLSEKKCADFRKLFKNWLEKYGEIKHIM